MRFENYDFVKHRNTFFAISIAITIIGVIVMGIFGLNEGVDFKAGTNLDITVGESITQAHARELLQQAGKEAETLTVGGADSDRVTARFDTVLTDAERQAVLKAFTDEYGEGVSSEENTVDAGMAREFTSKAIWAVVIASLFIIVYVMIRFEWRFAIAAIVALLHDVFIVVSVFSIFQLQVSLIFITAILTIIGYSINDTIVIFDRIRENMRFAKIKDRADLAEVVNNSIKQTMTRSINTVLTVIIAALALFIFGSEAIRLFSLAMLIGLISGCYSSIFIASQLWFLFKGKNPVNKPTPNKRKDVKERDGVQV